MQKASPRLRLPLPDQDWQRLESVRALVYTPLGAVPEVVDSVQTLKFALKVRFPSPAPLSINCLCNCAGKVQEEQVDFKNFPNSSARNRCDYRPLKLKVENNLIEPTRHAALVTLDQGVVPKNRRESVTKFLMANPLTGNDIMQYYYFFKQQYAVDDPAQDLAVLNKQRAEWKDMAESPYEATFEGLHARGSKAHCYGMFPAYFLSSYVLGVRLDGPVQNKTLLIEPRLGDLTEAAGTVATEFGLVPVSWEKAGEHWNFSVALPSGIKTCLRLPVGTGKFAAAVDGKNVSSHHKGRW